MKIMEDWERIHLLDRIYLEEERQLREQEFNEEINKKPAKIVIFTPIENILHHEHLPF